MAGVDPVYEPQAAPQFADTDQCLAILDNGTLNDQVPGTYPVTMKPSVNCDFNVDGKIAYVGLPEDNEKTIAFINELPIFHNIGDFESEESDLEAVAPDGVYTWILYKPPGAGKGNFSWAFRPVRSILEVGTLHKSIARAVGAKTIHAAGEMEKRDGKLTINYLSGSFMLKDCNREAKVKIMNQVFANYMGYIDYTFTDKTLITAQPTMEELQYYANKGFRICLHEPDKVDECNKVKGTCADALKPQEGAMRGGDENTTVKPLSQYEEAQRQLRLRKAGIAEPVSRVQGMGGKKRKTRRGKAKKSKKTLKRKL